MLRIEAPLASYFHRFRASGLKPMKKIGKSEKSQRVKTQRVKTSENFAEEKMFAEDIIIIFKKICQKIEDITSLDFRVFLDIFEIFAEDCFLLRSFRKLLPSGFLPLSRFQKI